MLIFDTLYKHLGHTLTTIQHDDEENGTTSIRVICKDCKGMIGEYTRKTEEIQKIEKAPENPGKKNQVMIECPCCHGVSTLQSWNAETAKVYDDLGDEGIKPLKANYFNTLDGYIPAYKTIRDYYFVCPKCKKEDIVGKDLFRRS